MTDYRYIYGSLLTETIIAEIPTYGVVMDMQMNKGGQFQGTFQLDQTGLNNDILQSACIPGRTWVAVERNGICIWHGFIWSRVYSAQSKSLQLYALSFENYPSKRLVTFDMDYNFVEQRNIFIDLWAKLQAVPNGNMNVNLPALFPTLIVKEVTGLASDFKYYNEPMSQIADSVNGFDWYIAVTKDGTNYRKDLIIGYPTLGSITVGNVFEYPGNITQYYLTESMIDAGTNVYVLGAGSGSSMLTAVGTDPAIYTQGWPVWDTDLTRKDIDNESAINAIARQQITVRRPPMTVIKATVKADKQPEFGGYGLGDTCLVVLSDPRNPNTFRANKRLLKWSLTPESSDNVEEVSLIFDGDPDI